jgi:hypothetical protein
MGRPADLPAADGGEHGEGAHYQSAPEHQRVFQVEPVLTREYRQLPANSARAGQGAAALIIGGSNANRLTAAFTDLGKKVETISGGGWKVTTESVDTLLPILRAKLDLLDPRPLLFYGAWTAISSDS